MNDQMGIVPDKLSAILKENNEYSVKKDIFKNRFSIFIKTFLLIWNTMLIQ